MSRADSLPETNFLNRFIQKLRYHEQSRQWFAVIFVLLVSWLGDTEQNLLVAGAVVASVGEIIRLWASGHVKKNKQLATDGPYAYVRHPLYVGNILIVVGFSIASSLWWSYILMVALLLFYYPPTISYEDNKLKNIFGDEWVQWSQNIHALIPTFGKKSGSISSEWSFKQSLMGNLEPVIAAYLVGCLYLLYRTI